MSKQRSMSKQVEFASFTDEERQAVDRIIQRTKEIFERAKFPPLDELGLMMDLSAAHATCPLRLVELADADPFNFSHDIGGIQRHLNRKTGYLEDGFLPRYAKPEAYDEQANE